jgi:hypothetical protein
MVCLGDKGSQERAAMFIFDAEPGGNILTFDVSDDALERAAELASGPAVTVGYCTHWYTCGWPL